jgi:4-hydroxyphenylacetate 3-monooxygenase
LRRNFDRYNELANSVLKQLDVAMPDIDLESIQAAAIAPRRPVTPSR